MAYSRYKKRFLANIAKEPLDNMDRISMRLQGIKRPPGAALQQKGFIQREMYNTAQQKKQDRQGFGTVKPQAYSQPNPNTPLERMYQDRMSRFGRNVRKNRFSGSEQGTQRQIKYIKGTNNLVRKQLERGEISQEAFANRYSFMPNSYSATRARGKVKK